MKKRCIRAHPGQFTLGFAGPEPAPIAVAAKPAAPVAACAPMTAPAFLPLARQAPPLSPAPAKPAPPSPTAPAPMPGAPVLVKLDDLRACLTANHLVESAMWIDDTVYDDGRLRARVFTRFA